MYQTREPDLDDTLATLEAAIEEFHKIKDTLCLAVDPASREGAETEGAGAEPSLLR